jgi:hypothetical protein
MSIVDDAIAQILADKKAALKEAEYWKAEAERWRENCDIRRRLEELGLTDRDNRAIRVRWVNTLRKIVDRRMPVNKMGSPMTTDVDVLLATYAEHIEALETLYANQNNRKNDSTEPNINCP